MLTIILTIFHVIVSVFLILVILLQTGKGADLGAMFGGGSSNTVFGSSGAGGFLTSLTKYGAVAFMINCLVLAYLSGKTGSSVLDELENEQTTQQQTAEPQEAVPATEADNKAAGEAAAEDANAAEANAAKPADEAADAAKADEPKAEDANAAGDAGATGEEAKADAPAEGEKSPQTDEKEAEPKTDTN